MSIGNMKLISDIERHIKRIEELRRQLELLTQISSPLKKYLDKKATSKQGGLNLKSNLSDT